MKRLIVLLAVAVLASFATSVASAHTFTASITCRQVVYSFASFPSGGHSLIHEQVTIDGTAVVTTDFTLNGSSGGNTLSINVPAGTHTVAATASWTVDGGGGSTLTQTLSGCQPTLTTNASGPVTAGGAIHDTAHLTGGVGTLTGTISFDVFDSTCATKLTTVAAATPVNGAGDYVSANYTPGAAGTYKWVAHYSGDSNNSKFDATCGDANETSTVNKTSPSIATLLSSSTVAAGGSVNDTATLSSASANAGGTVTYTVYNNNACTTGGRAAGTVTVMNGSVPPSNSLVFDTAGDFYWQAVYSGDASNGSATSLCTSEHLVVGKATPTLTTNAFGPVTVGGAIHDTAHLSGGSTLTGTITFDVYDSSCTSKLTTVAATTSVNGAGDYVSGNYTPSAAASYKWVAHYSGDANNNKLDTACGAANETSTVNATGPSLATTLSASTVTAGDSVHDSAKLSGVTANAGGSVTYSVYNNTACSGTPQNAGTKTVTNGGVPDSNAIVFATAGDFYWQVVYTGDADNGAATSPCTTEHLVVTSPPGGGGGGGGGGTQNTTASALVTTPTATVQPSAPAPVPAAPKPKSKPKSKPKPTFKPPKVKRKPAPAPCYTVAVSPKSLAAGKAGTLQLQVTGKNKPIAGTRVSIKGAGILMVSGRTNGAGKVAITLHPSKPGIIVFRSASYKSCSTARLGVVGAFTPPVTA
jgi:hypothetical protein